MSIRDGHLTSGVQELIEPDFQHALIERGAGMGMLLNAGLTELDDNS